MVFIQRFIRAFSVGGSVLGMCFGCSDDGGRAPPVDSGTPVDTQHDAGVPISADGSCQHPIELGNGVSARCSVSSRGAIDNARPSVDCSKFASTQPVPDVVLRYIPPADGMLVVSTDNFGTTKGLDTVVYVQQSCGDRTTELACNDDVGRGVYL